MEKLLRNNTDYTINKENKSMYYQIKNCVIKIRINIEIQTALRLETDDLIPVINV